MVLKPMAWTFSEPQGAFHCTCGCTSCLGVTTNGEDSPPLPCATILYTPSHSFGGHSTGVVPAVLPPAPSAMPLQVGLSPCGAPAAIHELMVASESAGNWLPGGM